MCCEPNAHAEGLSEASPGRGAGASSCPRRGRKKALPFALFLIVLASSPLLAGEGQWHVVAQGETLYSVARSCGLSASALMAANGISDPSRLRIGQKLLIPNAHIVAKGETLFGIARGAMTTVKELRRLNGLSDTAVIRVGEVLLLPSADSAASPSPPSTQEAKDGAVPTGTGDRAKAVASSKGSGPAQADPPPLATPAPSASGTDLRPAKGQGPAPAADLPLSRSPSPASSISLASADLPCTGAIRYLDGKVFGIAIRSTEGATVHSVTDGLVVSAGPYRGFGSVVFVQTHSGLIFVYGGNGRIDVKVGDQIRKGQNLGRVGNDPFSGATDAYFFVFKGSKALDPATAPRN